MTHKNRQEGSDEYATPPSLWRPLARAVSGFDVDPASGAESTPIADVRYTEDDDGLSKAWHGDAWLNPPFGDSPSTGPSKRERWLQKARQEANRDEVRSVSVLLPVDTSTQWFHNHVVEAPVLCLMGPGRMEFEGEQAEETGNTSFATCIAVFGDPPNELLDALEQFGAVFRGREFHASTVQKRLITDGGHRAPCEAVENMDPTPPDSFYDLERRVCPNCRLYFDVGASTDKVFCSDACRRRHERGELFADGGTDQLGDGEDRDSISMRAFNDLLKFEGDHATPTPNAAIIRDDNELLIYAKRARNSELEWEVRSFRVVGRKVKFTTPDVDRAGLAALLLEEFDEGSLTGPERRTPLRTGIPVSVAVDGKPAVAAWLYVRGETRETIADRMGVGNRTVSEYLSRFRTRGVGVPDDIEPPAVGETMGTVPSRFDPGASLQQIVADGGEARDE